MDAARTRLSIAALVLLLGCGYELDTTRHPDPRGSLGEEIYRILKADLDRLQPPKGEAFGRQRERFIRALDGLMPEPLLDALQAFLVETLPLYDAGRIQGLVRPLGCVLDELSRDGFSLEAIWYLRHPTGYGSDSVLLPLLRRLLLRPDLPELLSDLGRLWLAHDGLPAADGTADADAVFADLLEQAAISLNGRQAEAPDPDGGRAALVDWLLREDARFYLSPAETQWLLRTDERGRALPQPDGGPWPPAPFVDRDGDGLVDLEPRSGDYLGADGAPLALAAPFAADGTRPTQPGGALLYRYSDLHQTMLAVVLEQLGPLVEDGALWDLPVALPALLGPLQALSDDQGFYNGHRPADAPLYALAHALLAAVDYPRLPQLLEVLLTVAERHEAQLARLLHEIDRAAAVIDRYPERSLRPNNRLLDDLVVRLQECAERGYLLSTLRSFGDPRWRGLEAGLADMIRYRDVLVDSDMVFRQLTDFAASDATYSERSNLQRGVHLIHDTNGIRHAVSVAGWEPYAIEDMLVFYLDSAAGDHQSGLTSVPWYVTAAVTEFSSDNPPAEEVNRFMVHDHDVLGNPIGREGFELRLYNAEALLAFELSGALDGLRPMWTAFASRDRALARTGTKVLADLLAAVHPHYSCDLPYAASACAHLRALEPMLLEVLDSAELLDAVVELLASLQGSTTTGGLVVLDELDAFVRFLLQPDSSLRRHDGGTSVPGGDGITPVFPISRLYLLLDALRLVDEAVDADPAAQESFERLADLLYDRFLEVEPDGAAWRMKNQRAWLLLLDALVFLRDRVQREVDAGQLSARLAEWDSDLADFVAGRVLPQLLRAWELVSDHPDLPARLDALALDLLGSGDAAHTREARRLAGWGLQHAVVDRVTVPLGQALARRLQPSRAVVTWRTGVGCGPVPGPEQPNLRLLSDGLALVLDLLAIAVPDETGALRLPAQEMLANAGAGLPGDAEAWPLDDFLAIIGAIHRPDPASDSELQTTDLAAVLGQVVEYLFDDARGVEKLYVLVDRRDGF